MADKKKLGIAERFFLFVVALGILMIIVYYQAGKERQTHQQARSPQLFDEHVSECLQQGSSPQQDDQVQQCLKRVDVEHAEQAANELEEALEKDAHAAAHRAFEEKMKQLHDKIQPILERAGSGLQAELKNEATHINTLLTDDSADAKKSLDEELPKFLEICGKTLERAAPR